MAKYLAVVRVESSPMPAKSYRVLVADDHGVVRHGLRMLLESQPGIQVCWEASTGLEAMDYVKKERPDLLVLDLTMPEMNGLDVMRADSRGIAVDRRADPHHAFLRRAGAGSAALWRARLRPEVRRRHRTPRRSRSRASPPAIFYQPAGDIDGPELRSQAGRHAGSGEDGVIPNSPLTPRESRSREAPWRGKEQQRSGLDARRFHADDRKPPQSHHAQDELREFQRTRPLRHSQ